MSEMSFEEAARELGISEEELEKLVASGEIASTKDGDNLLFKKEAIENYQNQGDAEIVLADDELNLLMTTMKRSISALIFPMETMRPLGTAPRLLI